MSSLVSYFCAVIPVLRSDYDMAMYAQPAQFLQTEFEFVRKVDVPEENLPSHIPRPGEEATTESQGVDSKIQSLKNFQIEPPGPGPLSDRHSPF